MRAKARPKDESAVGTPSEGTSTTRRARTGSTGIASADAPPVGRCSGGRWLGARRCRGWLKERQRSGGVGDASAAEVVIGVIAKVRSDVDNLDRVRERARRRLRRGQAAESRTDTTASDSPDADAPEAGTPCV